jgi:parallel beta-helix repeat protein
MSGFPPKTMKQTVRPVFRMIGQFFLLVPLVHATVEFKVGAGQQFSKIQDAVNAIPTVLDQPYVITVSPGTYREMVTINGKQTSSVNTLTISGDPSSFPVLDEERERDYAISVDTESYITLENLTLQNARSYGNLFLFKSSFNNIHQCVIRNNTNYDGISLSGSVSNLIEHNVLLSNARAGIFLVNTSTDNTMRFNIFYQNGVGVQMDTTYPSVPVHEDWNDFCPGIATVGFDEGKNDLSIDPQFTNPNDFSIVSNSRVAAWGIAGQANAEKPQASDSNPEVPLAPVNYFYVDLSSVANRSAQDEKAGDHHGWTDQGDYDLRHVPLGPQILGGIPFLMPKTPDATSVIILKGKEPAPWLPEAVRSIPINRKAESLTFLHAIAWAAGDVVIKYIVHYEDGRSVEIPIRRHAEVDDWFNPIPVDDAQIAWKAKHPLHPELTAGLYSYTWQNPYPYLSIRTLDIESQEDATPIVVAITGMNLDPTRDLKVNLYSKSAASPPLDGGIELSLDCIARNPNEIATASLEVSGENGKVIFSSHPIAFKLKSGVSDPVEFSWQPPRQNASEIYRFQATVRADAKELGSAELYLNVPGEQITEHPPPTLPATMDGATPLGGPNLLYACEIQPRKQTLEGLPAEQIDAKIFDQLKANGGTTAHLIFWWSYLEPQPFQYDFSSIDWALEQCRRVGLKASISVWMSDHVVPKFVSDENMLDQSGHPFLDGRGRDNNPSLMPSLWGAKTRDHYRKLIHSICTRYLNEPTVTAWAYMYEHTEVVMHDRSGDPPIIYDYSASSQNAYKEYLQKIRKFSLDDLNHRYGTQYSSWEDVHEPIPESGLDVSLAWSDFQDFRIYSVRESFRFVFESVRQIDPNGKKRLWTFNPEFSQDICDKYNVVADITSSEDPQCLDWFLASRLNGYHPLIVEPTTIPPGRYEIGSGFFNALATPAQGYFWVGTVEKLMPVDTVAAGLFRKYRDAWVELSDCVRSQGNLAILRSEDTAMATDKVFFQYPRYWIGSNYNALMKLLQSNHYDYQPIYDSYFQMANRLPRQFKLIVDSNSLVMRKELRDALLKQVSDGATWIIQPETGRYSREDPLPAESVLAKLGWSNNLSEVWQASKDRALNVTASDSDALFAGRKLHFLQRYPIELLQGGNLIHALDGSVIAKMMRLGSGRIILMAGDLDWNDPDCAEFLNAIAVSIGILPAVATAPTIRSEILAKGQDRYLSLFNSDASKFTSSRVKFNLPEGVYQITNVTDSESSLGEASARGFQNGYPIILSPLEFRVYRFHLK